MNAFLRLAVLGLALLTGCSIESAGPRVGGDAPDAFLSIQRADDGHPGAPFDELVFVGEVFGDDAEGWSFLWRVQAGEIVGDSSSALVGWRLPSLAEAWIELRARRGADRLELRRTVTVWEFEEGFTLSFNPDLRSPGTFPVVLDGATHLGDGCQLAWTCEAGSLSGGGERVLWTVHAAGPHGIQVEETCYGRQRSASLTVTVEDLPPDVGLAPEFDHPYEVGRTTVVKVRATDGNLDPVTLDEAVGDGLEVLSVDELGPDPGDAWQNEWNLEARMGQTAGDCSIHLRLLSGGAEHERDVHLWLDDNQP